MEMVRKALLLVFDVGSCLASYLILAAWAYGSVHGHRGLWLEPYLWILWPCLVGETWWILARWWILRQFLQKLVFLLLTELLLLRECYFIC